MDFLVAIITGLAAGLHCSTWGMYKDSPHEGFEWPKYFRSVVIGVIYGPIVYYIIGFDLSTSAGMFLLFGSIYLFERVTLEIWKTFIRTEDQSKYFIPMQLHVLGKVIESRRTRYIAAFFYVGAILLVSWGIWSMYQLYLSGGFALNPYIILLFLSVGGWISAFGGAWKDAPLEGFETFKFFRSPSISYTFAFIAANLTDNFVIITLCSIGFTIATIETYKTFFFPSRPRGKFAGKPIDFPEMLKRRQYFVPVYVVIWLYVIVNGVIAFSSPHQGLVNPF
ncbi:MAG: hypothetical protein O2887_02640 [Bacteroidetes bacterium]|nr:hypothetical protein [Bacteroidota bacterium]MDA1119388.1 hypothetical protein [Bacteroidota bacterium]